MLALTVIHADLSSPCSWSQESLCGTGGKKSLKSQEQLDFCEGPTERLFQDLSICTQLRELSPRWLAWDSPHPAACCSPNHLQGAPGPACISLPSWCPTTSHTGSSSPPRQHPHLQGPSVWNAPLPFSVLKTDTVTKTHLSLAFFARDFQSLSCASTAFLPPP